MTAGSTLVDLWAAPESKPVSRRAGPVFVIVFVLLLFLLPSVVVLSGPLKSNGSPAVLMSLVAFGLVSLNFLGGLRDSLPPSAGALALITSGALELATWASGQTRSLDPIVRAGSLRGLLGLGAYTGIALAVMLFVRTSRDRFAIVLTILVGLIYCGFVGLLQGLTSIDPRYLFKPPGFVLNRDFSPQVRAGFVRAIGTSDSPIEFAVLMACLVALSIFVMRRAGTNATRALGVVGLLVGALGVPGSVSRTGVITLLGVILVYAFTIPLRATGIALFAFALVLTVFFIIEPSRFNELGNLFANVNKDESITGRTNDYAAVAHSFAQRPWFGAGLGTNDPTQSRYLDNQWLQAAVQGGITGIVATATLFISGFYAIFRGHGHQRGGSEAVAYFAVFVAILISSFTFDLFGFGQAKFLFFIVYGLAWSMRRELSQRALMNSTD